ncbi:hypothetical protein ACLOJK_009155 [Asimina triloba]
MHTTATHPPSQVRPPNQPPAQQTAPTRFIKAPRPRKTGPCAWITAIFCTILWIIIIAGGLIVLIVYLKFRPRSPRFDVSSASLNAAYPDTGRSGTLLNADLTILANFSNPNKKVDVAFDYLVVDVYYGGTPISTTSVDPFGEIRRESKLASLHFVASQVALSAEAAAKLEKDIAADEVAFEVVGSFRTRSKLGKLLQFSYWLHGRCSIVIGAPPSGVLKSKKCRTKR